MSRNCRVELLQSKTDGNVVRGGFLPDRLMLFSLSLFSQEKHDEMDCLTEQIEVHLLFFFLLFLDNSGGCGSGGATGGGRRGSAGEGGRIREEGLDLLDFFESVIEVTAKSGDVLETVHDGVREGGRGGDTDLAREGSHVGDTDGPLGQEDVIGQVEHGGIEDGTFLVDGKQLQGVSEGAHVHLQEKGGLGSGNLVTNIEDSDTGSQLNGTLNNLGGDVESLEEIGLGGVKTGRTSGKGDLDGGDDAGLGGGGLGVVVENFTDRADVGRVMNEDETDVTTNNLDELVQVQVGVGLLVLAKAGTDHSVLTHEDRGNLAQLNAHGLHLLGTNEIRMDNEDVRVGLDQVDQLFEVDLLLLEDGGGRHLEKVA